MVVNHHHLEAALAHLANHIKSLYPDKHYILGKAKLIKRNSTWELSIDRPYEELLIETGSRTIDFFPNTPPPYQVDLDEIRTETKVAMSDIFIDVEGLDKALILVDAFIENSQKLSKVYLFYVLNLCDSKRKAWQLDYLGENTNGQAVHIQIKVDVDTDVITHLQIIE